MGAFSLLVLTSAPILLIAILVRCTSPGPIIFWQNRSGLHGRPFRMYKFRSMVTNAEQARAELESMNEMSGPVFKVKNDPRVTPLGRWLRSFRSFHRSAKCFAVAMLLPPAANTSN